VPEAIGHYEQALRLMSEHVGVRNNLAWVLATSRDGAVRNGARAVALAEGANQSAGGKDAALLDTLAAAYAEAGRFEDAVRTAQAAMELVQAAGPAEQTRQIRGRLKLYQAGRPYHEGTTSGH
jgi:tetratricopeptide (TPR) repeat protein